MAAGEAIELLRPSVSYDGAMDEVVTWEPERVEGCLFDQPSAADADGALRHWGVRAAFRVHLPKGLSGSLRGCRVRRLRDGSEWEVAGDARWWPEELVPGPWHGSVIVGRADG